MTFLNYSFSKLVFFNKNNLTKILPENFETQENEFNEREQKKSKGLNFGYKSRTTKEEQV